MSQCVRPAPLFIGVSENAPQVPPATRAARASPWRPMATSATWSRARSARAERPRCHAAWACEGPYASPRRPTVSRLPWEAYSAWLKYHLEAFSANYSNGTGGAQRDDKQTGDDDSGGVDFALAGGGGVARVGAGEAQGGGAWAATTCRVAAMRRRCAEGPHPARTAPAAPRCLLLSARCILCGALGVVGCGNVRP